MPDTIAPDRKPDDGFLSGIVPENPLEVKQHLALYLSRYKNCFTHIAQFYHFTQYCMGLLSVLDRKSMEPIALDSNDDHGLSDLPRALQFFMRRSPWSLETMKAIYQLHLADLLSDEDAMLTADEVDIPKKGDKSPGVARMYCGATGKRDNCQASVMIGISGVKGYGLIDYRLYLPWIWFSDDYADQWKSCDIPKEIKFKTKNELLIDMINLLYDKGLFKFRWFGADSAFGHDSKLLDGLPENVLYFVGIHHDDCFFTSMPSVSLPDWGGVGRKPTRLKTDEKPVSASRIIDDADMPWTQVVSGIGAKGPVVVEYKSLRVIEARDGLPKNEIWLFARRFDGGKIKYSISNAPDDTPPEKLAEISLRRWPIEQCFEECKSDLGMDHFEGRSWKGWHRHMMIVFVVHLFLHLLRKTFLIDVRSLSDEDQKIYKISHPNDDETKGVIFTLGQARIIINSTFFGDKAIFMKGVKKAARYVKRQFQSLRSWLSKFHETYPNLSLKLSG
jgi:SRSO17 transposase